MVRQGGRLSLRIVIAFSTVLVLSVLLLISLHTFGIAVERRQELGLLLCLGATPPQLLGLLTGETSVLCGLGAGIGLASAALLRKPLEQLINLRLLEAGLALPHLPAAHLLSIGLLVWLLITAIGAIAALLSSAALLGRDPLRLVQNDG
jgi:putative ABC transport system permease protein